MGKGNRVPNVMYRHVRGTGKCLALPICGAFKWRRSIPHPILDRPVPCWTTYLLFGNVYWSVFQPRIRQSLWLCSSSERWVNFIEYDFPCDSSHYCLGCDTNYRHAIGLFINDNNFIKLRNRFWPSPVHGVRGDLLRQFDDVYDQVFRRLLPIGAALVYLSTRMGARVLQLIVCRPFTCY